MQEKSGQKTRPDPVVHVVNVKGQRVGVIISGGNVDIAQLAQYLATV
jgi:threonine dehydratase